MIEQQQLQDLLNEVNNKVCIVAAQERKARESRGEYFNVFNVLGLWSKEVRLHSAFIAELLNPNGIHGLGDKCLKAFLKQATIDEDFINANTVNPDIVERKIGDINETGTEGGRIDIILDDGSHALIIENKIYAGDQPNQLLRYFNYAQKFDEFRLIYLTLDGHEASTYSTGNVDKKDPLDGHEADEVSTEKNVYYNCMSYREDIIAWLTECAKIAFAHPLVRETINQYIQLIKQLTNINMEEKYINEVIEIAIDNKNIDSTIAILNAQKDISRYFRENYIFEPLEKYAKDRNWGIEINRDYKWLQFSIPDWTSGAKIRLVASSVWKNVYIGIAYDKGKVPEWTTEVKKLECLDDKPTELWPFGTEYLLISDWDSPSSYKAIMAGEAVRCIENKINQILDELKENRI